MTRKMLMTLLVAPQTVTLIAPIIALVVSLLTILWSTRLALVKERRQLLWSKELDRFFALEELAGQLVEELASHRAFDQSIGPRLQEFGQDAGRFARHDDVRRAILQLQNTLNRMFVAKKDHDDDQESLRSELDRDLKKLLNACDLVTERAEYIRVFSPWPWKKQRKG
jgi:hypothetical protein